MKRLILKLSAVALTIALMAPLTATAASKGPIYVIQKGDTLWGLSERFIKDPYYWPNLWAHNPFIGNPHLIYPGQKVRIRDGRLEILPASWQGDADEGQIPPLPIPVDAMPIKTHPGGEGFVATKDFQFSGTLLDFDSARMLAATGDVAFAEFKDLDSVFEGDEYSIFRRSRDIIHPETGEVFGQLIEELGELTIQRVNDEVATSMITRTVREVQRGDLLQPTTGYTRMVPLKAATGEISSTILGAWDTRSIFGQNDMVYLDQGTSAGLAKGNLVYLTRPRVATEYVEKKDVVELPDRLLGAAVIVDANVNSATALIVKSAVGIQAGDKARTFKP